MWLHFNEYLSQYSKKIDFNRKKGKTFKAKMLIGLTDTNVCCLGVMDCMLQKNRK